MVDPHENGILTYLVNTTARTQKVNVYLEDITGKYASIGLVGMHAEELLDELLPPPFNTCCLQYGTCQV